MTRVDAPPRAGRREWWGLAVLCLPTLLTTVDINVLLLALPRLSADLGAGSTQQLWITDIYGFMIAGFLVTMGTLGDRVGHRRVLLTGAAGFTIASVLAALSSSTGMLLISRALLGVAAATVMPSVLALISRMFPDPRQQGAAFGIWGSSIMLGLLLGPTIGGLLLSAFWWGSVFLMGVPVMLALLVTGPSLLPRSRSADPGRLDPLSVVLSLGAILPFAYGLKELARNGWHPVALLSIVVGLVLAAVFVVRQRQLTNPMLDLTLFTHPAVGSVVLFGLVIGFIMSGTGLVITQYLQLVEGLTPLRVGLWMLIPTFAMIVGGNVGPAIARRVRPAYVIAAGLVVSAAGALILTRVNREAGLAAVVIGLVVVFAGNGPGSSLGNLLLMSSAPPAKAGTAGSLSSTGGELGLALGVAILGSVANAVYRGQVDVPATVPAEGARAAGESIAGALSVAGGLPAPAGPELLASARDAFTSSLHVVSAITAVLFLGVAALVLTTLRHLPPTGATRPGAPID